MFIRALTTCFFLSISTAIHVPPSYRSFNVNQNTVQYIQSQQNAIQTAPGHYSHPSHSAYAQPVTVKAAPVFSSSHGAPRPYSSFSIAHHAVQKSRAAHAHAAPILHAAHALHTAPSLHAASALNSAPAVHAAPAVYAKPVFQSVHTAPVNQVSQVSAHVVPSKQYTPAVISHSAPVANNAHHMEEYGPPKYSFAYGVEDHHTGDIHSHKEERDGDFTRGEYSLHEADGTIRTVKYTVDKHSGFNAIVERSGHPNHPRGTAHQQAHQYHH